MEDGGRARRRRRARRQRLRLRRRRLRGRRVVRGDVTGGAESMRRGDGAEAGGVVGRGVGRREMCGLGGKDLTRGGRQVA